MEPVKESRINASFGMGETIILTGRQEQIRDLDLLPDGIEASWTTANIISLSGRAVFVMK